MPSNLKTVAAQFETQIRSNYCQNAEDIYDERVQALQKLCGRNVGQNVVV